MTPEFQGRAAAVADMRIRSVARREVICIIKEVALATGFTPRQIVSQDRTKAIVHARHLAMFEAKEAGASLGEIGRAFGRDHTSVIHAVRAERERREPKACVAPFDPSSIPGGEL